MSDAIGRLFDQCGIQPVLCDIGASGAPPAIWSPIATRSTYIGFDPDDRQFEGPPESPYRRTEIVRKAVTAGGADSVTFFLTKNPFCSSSLLPDSPALSAYVFSDYFEVEREVDVPAITLDAALASLSIDAIDWLKTDTQGTDLRLFTSLADDTRTRTLAVDVEPGLIDAYRGEDLFTDTHRAMSSEGFWLSRLNVQGVPRMRRSTLEVLSALGVDEAAATSHIRRSPGWCECRYLRTVESLEKRGSSEREYLLLWAFALLDDQPGFALEVSEAHRTKFGAGAASRITAAETLRRFQPTPARWTDRLRGSAGRMARLIWPRR